MAGVMIGEDDGLVVNGKTGPKVDNSGPKVVKNPIRWLINHDFIMSASIVCPVTYYIKQHFTGPRRSNPPRVRP